MESAKPFNRGEREAFDIEALRQYVDLTDENGVQITDPEVIWHLAEQYSVSELATMCGFAGYLRILAEEFPRANISKSQWLMNQAKLDLELERVKPSPNPDPSAKPLFSEESVARSARQMAQFSAWDEEEDRTTREQIEEAKKNLPPDKEVFDVKRFEDFYSLTDNQGDSRITPALIQHLEYKYYISNPNIKTMKEFAEYKQYLDAYDCN